MRPGSRLIRVRQAPGLVEGQYLSVRVAADVGRYLGSFLRLVSSRGLPIAHGKISWVQIGMLGPFEVRTDDGVFADVPGARLRGLLIALALEPGHVVPKATLVDWIWGERPPSEAANALQRLVSRLRKALPDGSVEGQTGRLPADGGTRRRRRRAVRTPRRPGPQ